MSPNDDSLPGESRIRFPLWNFLGGLLWIAAGIAAYRQCIAPIGSYDEGHLLTDSMLLADGSIPYRDFYTNYPPTIFWLVELAWRICGESVLCARLVGLLLHIFGALVAGRIAGRLAGRRFEGFASGLVFLWWRHQPLWPTAFMAGVVTLLLAIELSARAHASGRARDWAGAGLAYGLVGCFRHDLFLYAGASTALVLVGERIATRIRRGTQVSYLPRGAALGAFALACALPLGLVWGWVLWQAGWRNPLHDLALDQQRFMVPARRLPFPAFSRIKATQVALVLELAGPVLALWVVRSGRCRIAGLLMAAASLAVLPQMASRTDTQHIMFAVTPALIAAAVLAACPMKTVRFRGAWCAARVAAVLVLVVGALGGLRFRPGPEWVAVDHPRYGVAREVDAARAADRLRVLRFIEENTSADDPIFVGCNQHERINVNEMELYFLARRRGATRYMQFEPNIVNRDDVQAAMTADFEARHLRVAILAGDYIPEPNESARAGSARLDRYLAEHFEVVERAGPYQLLLRRQ